MATGSICAGQDFKYIESLESLEPWLHQDICVDVTEQRRGIRNAGESIRSLSTIAYSLLCGACALHKFPVRFFN